MSTPAQMESHASRVLNILESINVALGESGAMSLIENAHKSSVPAGLNRAFSSLALRIMSEAKAAHRQTPEEFAAAKEARAAKKAERAEKGKAARAAKKAALAQAGVKPKKPVKFKPKRSYDREKIGMKPDEIKALEKKDKEEAPKAPSGSKPKVSKKPAWLGRGSGDVATPPPAPAASAIPDDDEVAARIGSQLNKRRSRAKSPFEYAKGAAGLQQMRKRRDQGKVGSGVQKVTQGDPIHDKLDALHQTLNDLKTFVQQGRSKDEPKPHVPASQRWTTRQHPEDARRGESPEDFARNQAARRGELSDLERERQSRGRGRAARGEPDHAARSVKAKVSKLQRWKMKHPATRNREHDVAKGYKADEHPKWAGHHTDPSTGKAVHSSGKKANKKFANATTFGNSDDDAMLHTDKSQSGSRGSADDSEFAFTGDTEKDPRQKWYRVSKEGGYASAMASLGKSYHKDSATRDAVINKVKKTGFTGAKGHQIDVRPTGALHDERPDCAGKRGDALKARDPKEHYRLCKGTHDGPGGTVKGRSEYQKGFGPEHDDASKIRKLHKAAESGKKSLSGRHRSQGAGGRAAARAAQG